MRQSVIDVAPSLKLFQTCAMMSTRNVLIPAAMDSLSAAGAPGNFAGACPRSLATSDSFDWRLDLEHSVDCVNRLQMTGLVLESLDGPSARTGTAVFTPVRTDTAVLKAGRERQFRHDYDPKSKALEDTTK